MKRTLIIFLCLAVIAGTLAACGKVESADAFLYGEDTVFGDGEKTVDVIVTAADKKVVLTLKTDAATLADAMLEHSLIAGEDSEYGLYVKTVNGVVADYDKDGTYWALSKDGEMLMTGVSFVEISDGESYEFTKTK